jgi:hypothetical protein
MYVIVTSKPGKYRSEIVAGLRPLETYDYLFYGQKKAQFVIAELLDASARIRVIEDGTEIVNDVPSKFYEKFETVQRAFEQIKHLTTFGNMNTDLRKAGVTGS